MVFSGEPTSRELIASTRRVLADTRDQVASLRRQINRTKASVETALEGLRESEAALARLRKHNRGQLWMDCYRPPEHNDCKGPQVRSDRSRIQ
jgi:hypothetical protein